MLLPLKPQDSSGGGNDLTVVDLVLFLGFLGAMLAGVAMLLEAKTVRTRLIGAGIAVASFIAQMGVLLR